MKKFLVFVVAFAAVLLLASAVGLAQEIEAPYPQDLEQGVIFDGSINSYLTEWAAADEVEINLGGGFSGEFQAQKMDAPDGTFYVYLGGYIFDNTQADSDYVAFYIDGDHDETATVELEDVMCVIYRNEVLDEYHGKEGGGWELQDAITHCGEVRVLEVMGDRWHLELKLHVDGDPFRLDEWGLAIRLTTGAGQDEWPDFATVLNPDSWGDLILTELGDIKITMADETPEDHVWNIGDGFNEMIKFNAQSINYLMKLDTVTIKASGTGNELEDINNVMLVADDDEDGIYDVGETIFDNAVFTMDDGKITLNCGETVPTVWAIGYLIVYDMKEDAAGTYQFDVLEVTAEDTDTPVKVKKGFGEGALSSAVKTATGKCKGDMTLTLIQSTVHPSDVVSAVVSDLENCDGGNIRIKRNNCDSTTVSNCDIGEDGEGCTAAFTAPALEGLYTYIACLTIEKPLELSSIENAIKDLTVVPEEEITCGDYVVEAACTAAAECYWCNGLCQDIPCSCSIYENRVDCIVNNCNWCADGCQAEECAGPPVECTGTLAASITSQTFNPGDIIVINIIGLSDCIGATVSLYGGQCTGNILASTTLTKDTGSMTINAPTVGNYSYYVCSDLDGDDEFSAGEYTAVSFSVESGEAPPPSQDNTMLYVAVAIVAIIAVVIVVMTGILKK